MSDLLSRIGISRKLTLLTLLGVFAVLVLMALELVAERRTLMVEKETATRGLVETAVSLAGHFHARAESGEIGEDEAKAAAIAAIKSLRFGADDYFWINDMQPRMVMHPFKPEMDGSDLSGFADPDGVHLFVEAVKRVRDGACRVFSNESARASFSVVPGATVPRSTIDNFTADAPRRCGWGRGRRYGPGGGGPA